MYRTKPSEKYCTATSADGKSDLVSRPSPRPKPRSTAPLNAICRHENTSISFPPDHPPRRALGHYLFSLRCLQRQLRRLDVLAHPLEKDRPVRRQLVPAVVLPPCQFAADQCIHRRHGLVKIIRR